MIDGHYESFVVRLWVQSGEIARGEVSRTLSGQTERFVDLDALSRFLVESVAEAARGRGPVAGRVVEMRRQRAAGSEVASDE